ncbi:MAG TPA: FBP domain-containing protein [Myxococcales bacterium]|nr:FBP domain-containing protein [Myxococcales bacterium]
MFRLTSEEMLVRSFRPRDRKDLELPAGVKFPLFVRNYLAWRDPSGTSLRVVFSLPGGVPTGILLKRNHGDKQPTQMCEWCHTTGGSDEIGLLTADANSRKRVGIVACLDLRCQEKIEDAANRGGKSALDAEKALLERMGKFAREALGIDLSGAGRD